MEFTHIKIEQKAFPLDENFSDNSDAAINQERVARAAPEMLAALEYIATGGERWKDCARTARAAIAKAKGV